MKRGFKAEAERIAASTRKELGIRTLDPFDPLCLAQHLAIPVVGLLAMRKLGTAGFVNFFSKVDQETFSAVTVFRGYHRLIVHNDSHHPNRRASNISHELSHCLLEHEPTSLIGSDGQREWNRELEDEATWLAAALLLPREAAVTLMKRGHDAEAIAIHFGVSKPLCEWRLRKCGVYAQLSRLRAHSE